MTCLPIILFPGEIPAVSVNSQVKVGQVIASREQNKETIVNLPRELELSADKARKVLTRNPGDMIKEGDVLAVKKTFLGLRDMKLRSRVTGVFARYERGSGNLVIATGDSGVIEDRLSPIDGVVKMCDNEKILLETDKYVFFGRKGTDGSASGEIYVVDTAFSQNNGVALSKSEISQYYDLDSDAVGKIIVGRVFQRDMLIKGIGLGAIGIIGTEIRNEDIDYVNKRKMSIPIIEVDNDTIEQIIKWKGKKLYLNSGEKAIIFLHL